MVEPSEGRTGPSAVESCAASASAAMKAAAESLQARLELVLDERLGPLTADQRGFLQVALKDGKRLLKLIADFGEIAQADGGTLELEWARVDLGDAVHQAIVPVWPRAHALGKTIVVSVPEPTAIAADGSRLMDAVLRLVQQAVHHGTPGCAIELEVREGQVRIAYEADAPPAPDSLAIAHATAIAQAHGGSLTVVADQGRIEIAASFVGGEATLLPFVVVAA
jgi:signal transduction histidine kinase